MGAVIKINGTKYEAFNDLTINLNHANISSTFNFSALFEPENQNHRNLFKPFSYNSCVIETEQGQRVLTGTILSHGFKSTSKLEPAQLAGYSKTGVLADCTIAKSSYPLERTGLNLSEIAADICAPFGINVLTSRDATAASEVFEKVSADPSDTVAKFLIELASQKNLVLNHDINGDLFIELISTFSNPVAFFEDGEPDTVISLDCDGQSLHSAITVMKQASLDTDNASEQVFENPFVSAFRPLIKKQTSGNDNNTAEAARNSVLSELRNALKVKINVDRWTWRNDSPELIIPNRLIRVHSPNSYLFEPTNLFVDSVVLNSNKNSETAELTCVIPQIFQGGSLNNFF